MDSGLVGTHMYHLKAYKDTVVGKELVQWLVAQKSMCKHAHWFIVCMCACVCVCVCAHASIHSNGAYRFVVICGFDCVGFFA